MEPEFKLTDRLLSTLRNSWTFQPIFLIQGSAGLNYIPSIDVKTECPIVYLLVKILKDNNKIGFYQWGCCMYTVQTRSSLTPCSSLAPRAPGAMHLKASFQNSSLFCSNLVCSTAASEIFKNTNIHNGVSAGETSRGTTGEIWMRRNSD